MLVYVNDFLVIGSRKGVGRIKKELAKYFFTTQLKPHSHCLSIAVDNSEDVIFLSQRPFTNRVVELAEFADTKPTPTPLLLTQPLSDKEEPFTEIDEGEVRNVPYRSVLGSLLHLATRKRPEIVTAVSLLEKLLEAPAARH